VLGITADHGLVVPLSFRDRRYGVLVAFGRHGSFDEAQRRLLESFAGSAATAVATAETVADERRRTTIAAGEAERTRWARELHDETLQALGNLRLMLSAGRRGDDPERLRRAVDEALEQLGVDISSLRALIAELRPAALDQLGLEAALTALMDRTRQTGIEVAERIDLSHERGEASSRLLAEQETAIYRIVQEALTNIAKHARASRVQVEVVEDRSVIRIVVADDGVGFEPTTWSGGFGLEGIRERVELLDGELRIVSAPEEGTELTVTLIPRHQPAEDPPAPTADQRSFSAQHFRGAH
jgi:signal transduction histidine kinase